MDGVMFRDISFAYPGNPPVLRELNLEIDNGQRIALFGTSGSGKSTLVQVLFGLRRPQQGHVHLGGRSLGYAGSDPFLLHASVEENLRYGNPLATHDAVLTAARIAAADGFIEELPQGYQTIIGGRGQILSDGQRQRLGIARLVMNRPDILVFDEAFSALDPETEALVRRNLWAHFQDRIILVVTHRLGGLNEFNHLCLLQDGQIRQVDEKGLVMALGVTPTCKTGEAEKGKAHPTVKQPCRLLSLDEAQRSA